MELAAPLGCLSCGARGRILCAGCAAVLRPASPAPSVSSIDRIVAAWDYAGAARALVLALKLRGLRAAAGPLGEAIWEAAMRRGLAAEVLTWVPGRPADIRRRGFDHAHALASALGARLGLSVRALLQRSAVGPDQSRLTAQERWRNVSGAFSARACCSGRVAIVDDLVTTGATGTACAQALRAAGAAGVELLAACRASTGERGMTRSS